MNKTRLRRYVRYLKQYLFEEKVRGLDFTMRDTRIIKKSNGKFHGYSKTDEKHLNDIFGHLDYSRDLHFLDVGCGKGVALKEAAKYPFKSVSGIELQSDLCEIAKRNIRHLGLEEKIQCFCANAVEFDRYNEYNVFYFFNPFSEAVMKEVLDNLFSAEGVSYPITVIYHNPLFVQLFEEKAIVLQKEMLYDSVKDYETCILVLDKKDNKERQAI